MTTLAIRAVCFAAAVCACFAQDDGAKLHVAPRGGEQSLTSDDRSADRKNGPVKVDVDLVLVPATVTDQKDRVMIGLQKESFDILDQNNEELIRHFSSEDAPISLGIIFDTSDSMWGKIERSREPVVQFLRTSNPEDEFFLVGFNECPELLVRLYSFSRRNPGCVLKA
jgi:Ca-activated chloride channel family protein